MMLLVFCAFLACARAQFEVPDALVEPLSPKGLRVSIPGRLSTVNLNLTTECISWVQGH